MVQQLLSLSKRQSSAVQVARDLARDIHIGLADIDQVIEKICLFSSLASSLYSLLSNCFQSLIRKFEMLKNVIVM